MRPEAIDRGRIRSAWQGRISGCKLGKPLEVLSFRDALGGIRTYLRSASAFPLRTYVPLIEGTLVAQLGRECCRDHMTRAEPDDDINYTVLALLLLEDIGVTFDTADVARAWLDMRSYSLTTWWPEPWPSRTNLYEYREQNTPDANAPTPGLHRILDTIEKCRELT